VVVQSGCGVSNWVLWLSQNVVAHSGCGGSFRIWWLSSCVVAQSDRGLVAQWECGDSVGGRGGLVRIWRLSGDVVAQWGCGDSVGV
jgi:hypothetical protein